MRDTIDIEVECQWVLHTSRVLVVVLVRQAEVYESKSDDQNPEPTVVTLA